MRIPIGEASKIGNKYNQTQVIVVTFSKVDGYTHVVTWGKDIKDCEQAAQGGNFVKKALGLEDKLCHATPARIKKQGRTL